MTATIELLSDSSVVVLFLLLAAGFIAAALFYRFTLPHVSLVQRAVLSTLRGLAVALLLVLLAEPVVRLTRSADTPPVLAVVIDNSQSMRIVDHSGERSAHLRSLLTSDAFRAATAGATVQFFRFGNHLQPSAPFDPDSLPFDAQATDLAAALDELTSAHISTPLAAAILFSDGAYNVGSAPVYAAEALSFPVVVCALGDSMGQRDIQIVRVNANDIVFEGVPAPVDVTIRALGLRGQRAEISLTESGMLHSTAHITLDEGMRDYTVHLTYEPRGEGLKKYAVAVSPLPGELTTANNRQSFYARVIRGRQHTLILSGEPSVDATVIHQTLGEDAGLVVRLLSQQRTGGFYGGDLTDVLLDSTDCLILLGFPGTSTPEDAAVRVQEALARKPIPVLFVAASYTNYHLLQYLQGSLPFTWKTTTRSERLVSLQPSPQQRTHPLIVLDSARTTDTWTMLPPVFKTLSEFRPKPEATILAVTRPQDGILSEPFLLTRSLNRQRSIAILGYELWRWKLMGTTNTMTAGHLASFLRIAVQWLTSQEDVRAVHVAPVRPIVNQGEPVVFTAQVYDATNRPIDNAEVTLTARLEDRVVESTLQPVGNGRYEGTFEGLGEGDYTFQARASLGGVYLGTDRGQFSVGGLNLEFRDTRMNIQALRDIAVTSGGRLLLPAEIDSLGATLQTLGTLVPTSHITTTVFEARQKSLTLLFLVSILALEWILRKRYGML